ncbi:serpin family protein [candidate division KSB1 bacterium]
MRRIRFSVWLILTVVMFSCEHEEGRLLIPDPEPPVDIHRNLTTAEEHLVISGNKFAFKLFGDVAARETEPNLFISPLSISMALGMTYNGAAGDTKTAMESTLEYADLSVDDINSSYKSLIELLTYLDSDVTMNIANSIWHRPELEVKQDFITVNQDFFNAGVSPLDFTDPAASLTINNWVSEKTAGRIDRIVPDKIPFDVVMYLINAIYFKGMWTWQFDPADTRNALFYLPDGSTTTCRMMQREGTVRVSEHDLFTVIDLPYGNKLYSMTILLPHENQTTGDIIPLLNHDDWQEWMQNFTVHNDAMLLMPKFKMEYEITLNECLKALGMAVAFDQSNADFSGIADVSGLNNLFISEVKHKTYIDVNEEGTEAAAVTSVEIALRSMPRVYEINRPFLFVIRESKTGSIIFMGKIANPEY